MFIGRERELSALNRLYASGNIVGGTPQYLLQMDDSLSIADNIKQTFLNPISSLFEEPGNLLKQEIREPALYNAIITAIAAGASRMSEISSKVGESASVCTSYLKNLMALRLVQKEAPYKENSSRKSIYAISDNMFRFWYRFVPKNNSIIACGAAGLAYQRIAPHLSDYMGKIFEEICRQYLWALMLSGNSPVDSRELGRWRGTDPSSHSQTEIDIMGEQDKDSALFCECKWTNENVDTGVLEKLVKRSELFHYRHVHFYLFAKCEFTKGCIEKAEEMGNVTLTAYRDILELLLTNHLSFPDALS